MEDVIETYMILSSIALAAVLLLLFLILRLVVDICNSLEKRRGN